MSNLQRRWNHVLAAVDGAARSFGAYTAYRVSESEYVGRHPTHRTGTESVASMVTRLRGRGYQAQPLAAAKYLPHPTEPVDWGSYRKVPVEHPDVDAEIVENWRPGQCQYHVHLWPVSGGVDVYSHYELRPDLIRGDWSVGRLREHYSPDYGETYLRGVTDLDL